jgi:hypothetical protein
MLFVLPIIVEPTDKFKIDERVTITRIPPVLPKRPDLDSPRVYKQALGKTFRIVGIGPNGLLELNVTAHDTIWIEPQFVKPARQRRTK